MIFYWYEIDRSINDGMLMRNILYKFKLEILILSYYACVMQLQTTNQLKIFNMCHEYLQASTDL